MRRRAIASAHGSHESLLDRVARPESESMKRRRGWCGEIASRICRRGGRTLIGPRLSSAARTNESSGRIPRIDTMDYTLPS